MSSNLSQEKQTLISHMKKSLSLGYPKALLLLVGFLVAMLSALSLQAQSTQTIRGRVLDEVSQTALIGVSVVVISTTGETFGAITDVDGVYRIEKVPVGRHSIKITYIGYEEHGIPN